MMPSSRITSFFAIMFADIDRDAQYVKQRCGVCSLARTFLRLLVRCNGDATGLDQWLPVYQPFRALWQTALGVLPSFSRPRLFIPYGACLPRPVPFRRRQGFP